MPTTVNGIGTHYYGRKNTAVRRGECSSCRRVGNLTSYDTRLWFVVVFIPIIPLGRKRIMDQCPSCRRHYVADQDKFVAIRQESFDRARQEFLANPTVDAAVGLHGEMLFLHACDDATSFREQALARFREDAQLHAALGMQLEELGDVDSATPLYQRAFALDPQLPVARDGVARQKIIDGRLDEARALVAFLEKPGAGQQYPLARLHQLATGYQQAGRHEEALVIAAHLLRESPATGQHRDFRKFVQKSEVALNRFDTILPSQSRLRGLFDFHSPLYSARQRWAFFLTAAALLFIFTMAGLNEYYRQHRTIVVRNEFGPAVQVAVDGVAISAELQRQIVLPEGPHHVTVTGRLNDEFDLPMRSDYWKRWSNDPVWVVNVGGASPILFKKVHYAEHPRPSDAELHAGEKVYFAPHIDYLFKTPPNSLHVEHESSKEITKTCLSIATETPDDIFQYALNSRPLDVALTYAESRLLLEPGNNDLLRRYFSAVVEAAQGDRAKAFIKGQLAERPVLVNWHRMYHELFPSTAERVALIRQYDDFLASEPNDAALLYLRGRLAPTHGEAHAFFDRSKTANPQFSWPWAALGIEALTNGDWKRCQDCIQQALQRHHEDDVTSYVHMARLGLGEGPALEREYREKIASTPPHDSLASVLRLTTVLVARGDNPAAQLALNTWEFNFPPNERPTALLEPYRGLLELMAGDLPAVERRIATNKSDPDLKLHFLLAANRPADAAADSSLAKELEDPWNALALSLAFELAGNNSQAQIWRDKTFAALSQLGFDEVRAAEMLHASQPPKLADFDEIALIPTQKALLAAALSVHFPEQHKDLAALAKRLAVQPTMDTPLINRAIGFQPR